MFAKYKRFERYFFRVDKAEDMTAHIKLKHQFRAMLLLTVLAALPTIYYIITYRMFVPTGPVLFLAVLFGFKNKYYNTIRALFFILMTISPPRYPSTLVLITPVALISSNLQILVHTHSHNLMVVHLAIQAVIFYFYGIDIMVARVQKMSAEELAISVKQAMGYAFLVGFLNLGFMKLYYSQFSKLLKKLNKFKDDLSRANNELNSKNIQLQGNLELKDVFIYTFSHELKNALNGLLGNLSLAYDTEKDPRVLQYLSLAKVCGEVLKNFVHNILDSGKLENGTLEVAPERKNVMHFMQNVWAICGRIIQNKRLKGYLEIERSVPRYLDLDEQRMIQIILNLTSNACKFTEKGYVRLSIRWQTISAAPSRNTESTNEHNIQRRNASFGRFVRVS